MNETDRELLEWAFKAYRPGENYIRMVNDAGYDYWNPIRDDGDAFRLAHTVPMIVTPGTARLLDGRLFGVDNKDIAATRRAIVRAAAEIGKAMV